ncbi:MAG: hypothetical protein HUJ76_08295 [Parasporobacterium sp.]|nr:hypothetical protein [Parasporobacterium sp.]
MLNKINRKQVENILRNRAEILKRISETEERIRSQMEDEGDIIREASIPSAGASLLNDNVRKGSHHDLQDTLDRYYILTARIRKEVERQLQVLSEEKEMVFRVWVCFCTIRNSSRYYEVLYENVINDISLGSLAEKYDRTLNTISVWKRKALDMIADLYNREDLPVEVMNEFAERNNLT